MQIKAPWLLLSSLFFCHAALSSTKDDYFENMITLQVGSYLQQEFVKVISDIDGGIYLNISDLLEITELTEYTQLSINKENITLLMAGNLFSNRQEWQITTELKKLNSIEIDGRLYLDKEKIGELLPLEGVKWFEEKYTLIISPAFNLPLDTRINTEKRKRQLEQNKNSKEDSQEQDLFMKADRKMIDIGMLKLRYDINDFANYLKEKENVGNLEIEYSSQLLYGDFNIRHNLYASGELQDISLSYPYLLQNKTVSIGDNYISGNDILGYNSQMRGISVSTHDYSVQRSGRELTIKGEAAKNSSVEIYQNGKVVDYQTVQGKEYEFTVEMRSQQDAFQIKIYDRNGVFIKEEYINILEGNGFLSSGEWDYNLFYGQNPKAKNRDWDDLKYGFSYGLTNNLSYAFDYYNTRNDEKLYHYAKHRAGYRFSTLAVPLALNFSYYDSFEDNSAGYIAELESELFSHQLYYSYEQYSDLLAQDENKDSYQEVEISRDYSKNDYFLRFSIKNYQGRVEEKYDTGLSYDITREIGMDLDFGKTILKNDERRSNYTGGITFNTRQGDFSYRLVALYQQAKDPKWRYKGSIRKRLSPDSKYSYNFTVDYNKKDLLSLNIGFEYKFNAFLKMDYNYGSDKEQKHNIDASYEQVIDLENPFTLNSARSPDQGYIEGTIFIDKNGNSKMEHDEQRLVDVNVAIGENRVKTNKEGLFYLSDVSPYRNNKLSYDYSGTTIDPTLQAYEHQDVNIIPASGKKIEMGLIPLSMIMGSINLSALEAKQKRKFISYVEIIVEKDGIYLRSIKPEYDGFYVVQDLQPGNYLLTINYLGSEEITLDKGALKINVRSGETGDFYEGIDFNVVDIQAKKINTIFHHSEKPQ